MTSLQSKVLLLAMAAFVGLSLNAVCSSPTQVEEGEKKEHRDEGVNTLVLQKLSDDDFLSDITRQFPPQYGSSGLVSIPGFGSIDNGCPDCDASVYSYCSYKMVHDSCCCDYLGAPFKPPQCLFADCTLLYAKSCFDYSLLQNCCCNK